MVELKTNKNLKEINNEIASRNNKLFQEKKVFVVNLMSSPGAGKTSLLENTLGMIKNKFNLGVIEGDLQTSKDAERIEKLDVPVFQINTHGGCHLDARMIEKSLQHFELDKLDCLFIENVGNLVCPAGFNLGEHKKVVLLSTPEGVDKPAKYPKIFRQADIVIINKKDIAQYCDFDISLAEEDIKKIKPNIPIHYMSCREKTGIEPWIEWIREQIMNVGAV